MVGQLEQISDLWDVLNSVADPEIPVLSIVDLGIVRSVSIDTVTISPTYTGCPAIAAIEASIREALDASRFNETQITTALYPPWTTDWISQEGRRKLQAYGIAPPDRSGPPRCPQCLSIQTTEISRFGSTACKSLWRCEKCQEPFDHFKCH
jgi:ring-1,2-phenylacetyl-CoA epoxidase subunit PaaD